MLLLWRHVSRFQPLGSKSSQHARVFLANLAKPFEEIIWHVSTSPPFSSYWCTPVFNPEFTVAGQSSHRLLHLNVWLWRNLFCQACVGFTLLKKRPTCFPSYNVPIHRRFALRACTVYTNDTGYWFTRAQSWPVSEMLSSELLCRWKIFLAWTVQIFTIRDWPLSLSKPFL